MGPVWAGVVGWVDGAGDDVVAGVSVVQAKVKTIVTARIMTKRIKTLFESFNIFLPPDYWQVIVINHPFYNAKFPPFYVVFQ